MRFATFLLLPVAAVMAIPQTGPAPVNPDLDQINRGIAEAQAAINKLINARQNVPTDTLVDPSTAPGNSAVSAGNTDAKAPPDGGKGIGGALSDLTTLLSGLANTLTGLCNLRDDLSSLTSSLGGGK